MAQPRWLQPLLADRRLLVLLCIAALVVLAELGLRGWDAQRALDTELQQVRSRAAMLAAGTDVQDWAALTRSAETERAALQARLWQSPTEAQAQARLRDWLTLALRSAAVVRPAVNLLPLQVAAVASSPSGGASANANASASASAGTNALPALRVRASINFDLTPQVLENALLQIEAGGQLARIDSLSVSARTRRVEMTVSVPVLLKAQVAP